MLVVHCIIGLTFHHCAITISSTGTGMGSSMAAERVGIGEHWTTAAAEVLGGPGWMWGHYGWKWGHCSAAAVRGRQSVQTGSQAAEAGSRLWEVFGCLLCVPATPRQRDVMWQWMIFNAKQDRRSQLSGTFILLLLWFFGVCSESMNWSW